MLNSILYTRWLSSGRMNLRLKWVLEFFVVVLKTYLKYTTGITEFLSNTEELSTAPKRYATVMLSVNNYFRTKMAWLEVF